MFVHYQIDLPGC